MSGSVTVVICAYTRNRWDDIVMAVGSVLRQPEAEQIILVIDHEPELLELARSTWPTLTVVPNTFKQGLSGARNTALEIATSDIVAFLDDDATASPTWLRELLSGFDSSDVVAVGGSASPRWPAGGPFDTLPPELLWVVGCTYVGQPTSRADVRNVIGCSMAFRRLSLLEVGGFNVETGRVGTIPLGAEETETCIRLRQADPTRRIVFEPRSTVLHTVTADRVTWRYLRRRSFFEGVSKSALSRDLGSSDALSSERSYATRVLPAGAWREIRHGRPLGAVAIVVSLAAASLGYAYGTVRGSRRATMASATPSGTDAPPGTDRPSS